MEYARKEVTRMILKINGDIINNDLKGVYNWYGFESTCPLDVQNAIASLPKGENLEVKINSGGGMVTAGQEIYSMLRAQKDVNIEIESLAASAASIIAMAGHCTISPIGMIMIHDVSGWQAGNHKDLSKMADTLRQYDKALAQAYVEKTGKPLDEILTLMDRETWLTAQRALELGFVDGITEPVNEGLTNGTLKVTPEMVAQYRAAVENQKQREAEKAELLKDLDSFGS